LDNIVSSKACWHGTILEREPSKMPDNQTPDEWLDLAEVSNNPGAQGTGLSLRVSGTTKEITSNVTYDLFLRIAQEANVFAFTFLSG
jgi:hypothetical protein